VAFPETEKSALRIGKLCCFSQRTFNNVQLFSDATKHPTADPMVQGPWVGVKSIAGYGHMASKRGCFLQPRLLAWAMATVLGCSPSLSADAASVGVYVGNDPPDVVQFEKWLGCRAQQILVFTDERNWKNIASPQWFVDRFAKLDRPAIWSIAMVPKGSSLALAATGTHDQYYAAAARALAHARPDSQGLIHVRFGWELNGDWFPWAAEGKERAFIDTFRHMVDSFRSVSSKFRFEWNINYGRPMDPATAYPGDQYVDVIGMDFYWMPENLGNDPVEAFAKIRDDRYGLRYLQGFAAAHHKPVAFSEWGVTGDNAEPFIDAVRQWIQANGIAYSNYWNSDGDYPGRLSDNRWPHSGAAFRKAFCPQNSPK
jgi:hypothetical protein